MVKIKEFRIKNNLTTKEVANYLGVTSACISQYESGRRRVSVLMLKKYAMLFNCLVDDLID